MSGTALPSSRNPFRTERLHRLGYREPATGAPADLAPLLERFESLGRRSAVVGPEGSGKTTLLDALEPRWRERGYDVRRLRAAAGDGALRGSAGERVVRREGEDAEPGTILWMIDGYDRLRYRDRLRVGRLARTAAGLLVTTHRRSRMPVLHRCSTTPRLLAVLVADLAGSAAASAHSGARELHARHRGNLRAALLELYDRSAGRSVG